MGVGELPVKIRLDLSRHCVETEIKRLYNRNVSRYFKNRLGRQDIEIQIDLLKQALEQLDFPNLRSRHPILAGNVEGDIFLGVDADGNMQLMTPEEVIRF
ncbi:MAG: hypothetical protein LJE94_05375 [Deltaproteobacteria bacterium]|nr:hypothetical protein [Deltaproteobacteria bacterium]